VTTQIKQMEKSDTLGVGTLEMARAEMCMGKGKGVQTLGDDDGLEVQVDADFMMAQMLCDEDGTGLGAVFDELQGGEQVVTLPSWCVEVPDQVSEPATPPQKKSAGKPPTPRTGPGGKKKIPMQSTGIQKTALPGYFRVVRHSGALSEPLDLTLNKKRGGKAPVVAATVRALTYVEPTTDSLMCTESSALLMTETADWKAVVTEAFTIRLGKYVTPYAPLCKWKTGEELIPDGLTLNQALALRV
jgi:hypothetical protein